MLGCSDFSCHPLAMFSSSYKKVKPNYITTLSINRMCSSRCAIWKDGTNDNAVIFDPQSICTT